MQTRREEIQHAFKLNGIVLKDELDDAKKYPMQDSHTNQYFTVEDINGNQYLLRINGKLFPPFTREDEQFNLKQLKDNHIDTTVMVNNTQFGFQICRFNKEKNRFSNLKQNEDRDNLFKKIALGIKKFHRVGHFKNQYHIADTIDHSLKPVAETEKNKLHSYSELILSMLSTINSDVENYVSSHNDLLPSSIYIDNKRISFVDWEYSAGNHRSYDLAWLSTKASLTPQQEQKLVTAYDVNDHLNMQYSVAVMKPIIHYLLLL